MALLRSVITALLFSVATASPVEQNVGRDVAAVSGNELFERAGPCTVPAGSGTCASVSANQCPGGTFYPGSGPPWPCPGDNDIQCCVKSGGGGQSCSVSQGSGTCASVSGGGCPGGTFYAGTGPNWPCPGSDDIQCCVKGGGGGGQSCSVSQGSGTCASVFGGGCPGGTFYAGTGPNWPCPGSDDIQCCVKGGGGGGQSCSVSQGSGTCASVSSGGCPGGTFYAGTGPNWPCPGSDDIQCCVKGNPGGGGGDVAQKILAKAMTAAGTPYAWGGGNCNGPTGDQPPWDYGEIGFDCSGLVAWAICQVTGRNLFAEGLRVTSSMYCASAAQLRYQKYPYSQRKLGDAVFFGGACDCNKRSTIHHVGLMMDSGDRMWNAPNDQINKVLELSISRFGEKPCPYVIRFG